MRSWTPIAPRTCRNLLNIPTPPRKTTSTTRSCCASSAPRSLGKQFLQLVVRICGDARLFCAQFSFGLSDFGNDAASGERNHQTRDAAEEDADAHDRAEHPFGARWPRLPDHHAQDQRDDAVNQEPA